MDAAPPPSPVPASASPPPPDVVRAWPPSAQWATAFLLGVAVTLLVVHAFTYLRGGTRPTEHIPYRLDLNTATRAELDQLPGVGPARAGLIEEHRRLHGRFRSVEELRQIAGIGPATFERVRPWVRVVPPETNEVEPARPSVVRDGAFAVSLPRPTADTIDRRPLSKKEENLKGPIDVNRAGLDELQRLPGIGPKLAQRILDERAKRPFQAVDELRRVSGIGPKILERLRPYVTVGGDPQRVARSGGG